MTPEQFIRKFNWSTETLTVARRSNFRCVYCNHFFFQDVASWIQFNVDHLRPGSSGDRDERIENKVAACWPCNKLKSTFDPGNGNPEAPLQDLIEIAKRHIDEVRAKRREKVDGMREAIRNLEEGNAGAPTA
jgi:5-methylcytosine-specific restriction endonuclease McrA